MRQNTTSFAYMTFWKNCLFVFYKLDDMNRGFGSNSLADKYLKKDRTIPQSTDAFDAFRSLHFKVDQRSNAEKVKDSVAEAGHETRSVNQVVKMVNLSISEKVKRLEKLKEDSKRFDDELNLFMGSSNAQQSQVPATPSVPNPQTSPQAAPQTVTPPVQNQAASPSELYFISRDLRSIINKYGLQKFSTALNGVLSEINNAENQTQ